MLAMNARCGDAVPDRTAPHPQGRRERRHRASVFAFLAIGVIAAFLPSAHAQDSVEAFYQGRQINLVVGYGPGGGYDLTARLVARHIGQYIPGNPSVAVQNMVGAGSLRAANYLYGAAPTDRATLGAFGSDIAMIGLIGANTAVPFHARQVPWRPPLFACSRPGPFL